MSSSSVRTTSATQIGSLPMMLAALLGQNAATFGLTAPLISPSYTILLAVLSTAGALTARYLRSRNLGRDYLLAGAIGLVGFFFVIQATIVRFGKSLPIDFLVSTNDMSLLAALTLTAAVATFFWLTDGATLFCCVWSMAMIGLAATLNLNVITLVCFGIFLFCALFLMTHQHTLSQAGTHGRLLVVKNPLLGLQLRTAALLWVATWTLGVIVAVPLQMIGRNMSLATVLERLKLTPEANKLRNNSKPRLTFDSPDSFAVGLGPVTDSDTLIYRVTTQETHYWRMRTFATCKGNEWIPFENDLAGQTLVPETTKAGRNVFTLSSALEGVRQKTQRVKAKVEPLVATRAMIHLVEPRQLLADQATIVRRVDGTFALVGRRMDIALPPGPYELEADVSRASPEELNNSSVTYPKEILERYLQEPNVGMLDTLAQEAIGTERLPYNKAEAIRKFVTNRCTYSLDAPACPLGRNPAEWFLNDSKVGYCDLYATAVTLLCRAARIPARIATGFNAGETDPDHPNAYHLRERNRHAWCEVYFTGYGWVPFDATVLTVDATMAPLASAPLPKTQAGKLPVGPLVLVGIAVLGLLGVGGAELLRRRGVLPGRATISVEEIYARRLLITYKHALHQLKRHGATRESAMTVGEHIAVVTQRLGDSVGSAYERLARLSERTLFARQPTRESDVITGQEALAALKIALKTKERKY
ncbi:DUF4129 domain-containing transglutaminase family protein [Armatimonas sp.]|uniref:DUF4129 domain-containing transglutaminase family protein n=1 Tax=Armatimonas sp. TaxID=1872638 RepID=UPI00375266E0